VSTREDGIEVRPATTETVAPEPPLRKIWLTFTSSLGLDELGKTSKYSVAAMPLEEKPTFKTVPLLLLTTTHLVT
jgi:hypothetical protein